jgi:hypothetical protein
MWVLIAFMLTGDPSEEVRVVGVHSSEAECHAYGQTMTETHMCARWGDVVDTRRIVIYDGPHTTDSPTPVNLRDMVTNNGTDRTN